MAISYQSTTVHDMDHIVSHYETMWSNHRPWTGKSDAGSRPGSRSHRTSPSGSVVGR